MNATTSDQHRPTTTSPTSPRWTSRSGCAARSTTGWWPASAAAIADYLDVDVTIVRIVIAALTIAGGAGVAVYIAGWLLIPEEGSDHSVADEFISSLGSRSR